VPEPFIMFKKKPKPKQENYNTITTKQVEEWTSSFDSLLASDRGRDMFREHLLNEGNERHLEFYLRCEQLQRTYSGLQSDANDIYETFLDIDAPRKVNVYGAAEDAWQSLQQQPQRLPPFEEAQKRIKARMEQDSYPRFCEQLVKQHKAGK